MRIVAMVAMYKLKKLMSMSSNGTFAKVEKRRNERPKSVKDLFNDDPELELPVIKNLNTQSTEASFFDASLMRRVKAASNRYTNDNSSKFELENKAARNIPELRNKKD